jgi:hypothetical protein
MLVALRPEVATAATARISKMTEFSFEWLGEGSLHDALSKPIHAVALSLLPLRTVYAAKLWREDGTAIVVYSRMLYVAERDEVGVLTFAPTTEVSDDDVLFPLPQGANTVTSLSKLSTLEPNDILAESGLIIGLRPDLELVVVAGAFPLSLAISGLEDWDGEFEPEYQLDWYTRSPL